MGKLKLISHQPLYSRKICLCCFGMLFFFRMQLVEMRDHIVKEPLNVMRLFRLRARYEVVEEKVSVKFKFCRFERLV